MRKVKVFTSTTYATDTLAGDRLTASCDKFIESTGCKVINIRTDHTEHTLMLVLLYEVQ